jgi:PleD family two-component response regulator
MADQQSNIQPSEDQEREMVLVVDDHAENVHLLSRILRLEGYNVETATNGLEALASVQTSLPDLIILDIMMPGMDGFEVCKHLKAEEPTRDVPVIFISALGASTEKIQGFAAGGVDYVTKPFHAKEVLARVRTHLAIRRLQKQLETRNADLQKRNAELQEALDTIQTLSGLIPICAWCGRRIEDEEGQWVTVEDYVEAHSTATFTHGMCPACYEKQRQKAMKLADERRQSNKQG